MSSRLPRKILLGSDDVGSSVEQFRYSRGGNRRGVPECAPVSPEMSPRSPNGEESAAASGKASQSWLLRHFEADAVDARLSRKQSLSHVRNTYYNKHMDEHAGLGRLRDRFEAITGLRVEAWDTPQSPSPAQPDAVIAAGGRQFWVVYRAAANTEQVGSGLSRIADQAPIEGIPLLVVPYMGETGQQLCSQAGVSWLDLSGNAEIVGPGLRVRVLGQPNRYKRPGRPTSLFAPRSARLARALLLEQQRSFTQSDLIELTSLSRGYLSRLLARYEEAGLVERRAEGRGWRYRCPNPAGLLTTWRADYDFAEHTILRGHVAARTGPELARQLVAGLGSLKIDHAVTGLAAAWLWAPFAAFRTVTIYLRAWPPTELLEQIGFHEGERGSNTWLVIPTDEGVFDGSTELDGVRCASAVQVYLDLKGQAERAAEAAEELRRRQLLWAEHDERVTS